MDPREDLDKDLEAVRSLLATRQVRTGRWKQLEVLKPTIDDIEDAHQILTAAVAKAQDLRNAALTEIPGRRS